MKLQLLDFDKFIASNNILKVSSYKMPTTSYDEDGLWSETIFGNFGSRARFEKFGYIDLKSKFIHPSVMELVTTVSTNVSKVVRDSGAFKFIDGEFVEEVGGQSGIAFLLNNIDNVDFTKGCHTHKKEVAEYLNKNRKNILIDKFLVQPAGLRDIDIHNKQKVTQVDEINSYYTKLLIYTEQLTGIQDLDNISFSKIQNHLVNLYRFIQNTRMKGKKGFLRGKMLSKTLDYSSRLILTNDPGIKFGTVGLPWHTLVAIYEPFVINKLFFNKIENGLSDYALEQLAAYMGIEKVTQLQFNKFTRELIKNPDIIPNELKSALTDVLNTFLSDQIVMVKRDPVVQRNSWFSAVPTITEGRAAYVNSVYLGPMGGDCCTGDVVIFKKEGGKFIKSIESIDDFYKNHKLKFLYQKDNVYMFEILDEVYSLGVNEKTRGLKYTRINHWSIHTDLKLYKMTYGKSTSVISSTNSCYVLNQENQEFEKLSVKEVIENKSDNLLFMMRHKPTDQVPIFIKSKNVTFKEYTPRKSIKITIGDLEIKSSLSKIAYDFTMDVYDPFVRSFLHSSGFIQCNSDGDQVAIIPVFSESAKKEVSSKMNLATSPSKWTNPNSYNEIPFVPTLDTIATIFKATSDG